MEPSRGFFEFRPANPAIMVHLDDQHHFPQSKFRVNALAESTRLVGIVRAKTEQPWNIGLSGGWIARKSQDWDADLVGDLFRQMGDSTVCGSQHHKGVILLDQFKNLCARLAPLT